MGLTHFPNGIASFGIPVIGGADADSCINMAAAATGILAYNACSGGHATAGIVCGNLGSLENYYELSTSDLSGVLEPAVA